MAKNSNGLLCKLGIVKSPGAAVPHRKNTKDCVTVDMPVPAKVTMVMQQHIGAPCMPLVQVGDRVKRGQKIGDAEGLCVPVHASVSCTVVAIEPRKVVKIDSILMQSGAKTQVVIIESDGQQTIDPSIKPPVIESEADLVKAARDSGLVGLGGAGFPTHIKINPNPAVKANIDYLLINAAECEPYLTPDVREILENAEYVVKGMELIAKHLEVKNAVIGIEDNKPEAIKLMTELLAQVKVDGINFKVETLPSRYPQGAEKVLIDQCTGREVPPGKLPSDVGCVVMNVTSIAVLAQYVETGMPLLTKRLTVDGSAITKPMNVRVPIGTSVKDVIEFCGGYKGTPKKLISGGPMMGLALVTDDFPILKQNNGLLVFGETETQSTPTTACIRCGACLNSCPFGLAPAAIAAAYNRKDTEALKAFSVESCMECGCCSYVCPANRPLVQINKLSKQFLKEEKMKDKACHCEPVRRPVWQSVLQNVQILTEMRKKLLVSGDADCHVAKAPRNDTISLVTSLTS